MEVGLRLRRYKRRRAKRWTSSSRANSITFKRIYCKASGTLPVCTYGKQVCVKNHNFFVGSNKWTLFTLYSEIFRKQHSIDIVPSDIFINFVFQSRRVCRTQLMSFFLQRFGKNVLEYRLNEY